MSRAEDLAAKGARIKASRSAPAEVRPSADAEIRPSADADVRRLPPRVKPVRLNVDVTPAARAALRRLCAELEVELGGTPVSGQDVLRCLMRWPLVDDEARRRLLRELAGERQ